MSDPNIGRKVSDRYELIEPIGQGSMGKVYLAGDSLLGGVPVAVKFLSQTLLNENMRTRFFTEAMTCAQLGQKSMHVVRVSDYGVNEDDIPFYVMEYLKGESVGRLLKRNPIPVPRFIGLTKQILLGLRTAHNGILVEGEVVPIIHRDIKPSNILVTSDPSMGELVKILDFGIAKLMQAGSEQTSTFMGTLAYASPEQMEGRELDSRSDIYSLGVMMYQMLSGTLPVKPVKNTFGSWYKVHRLAVPKSFSEFQADFKIPDDLEDVVMACLSKQREDRPENVDTILDRVTAIEARVGAGFQVSQRISATFAKLSLPRRELDQAQSGAAAEGSMSHEEGTGQRRSLIEDQSLIRNLEALLDESGEEDADDEIVAKPTDRSKKTEESHTQAASGVDNSLAESNSLLPEETSEEAFYLQQNWPPEMPIAQIVFPKLLIPPPLVSTHSESLAAENPPHHSPQSSSHLSAPTLWAMMPESEIKQRIRDTRYNNFLCTMSPHPMVLWLTAFYSESEGPRWLPCYLDLKDETSQKILWTLSEIQYYRILFFTKEPPHHCIHLRKLTVANNQLKLFKEWTMSARSSRSVGNPQDSKALLKQELESNLKPKILTNFAALPSTTNPGLESSLSA
ncbi:MAG: serine/threonine-protein kinase [Cyanobacteria bacterium P01_D01_bin.105]